MHGPYGEDGTVQGALEVLGIPYAGPGVLAAATTIDKLTFKRLLADAGVPQVDFCQAYLPGPAPAIPTGASRSPSSGSPSGSSPRGSAPASASSRWTTSPISTPR